MASISLDFLINLLANIATAVVLAGGAWVVVRRRRHRFARFFGLSPDARQIHIYLSSIAVRERGSIATAPMRLGFHGEALSEVEFQNANRLSASLSGRASALTIALLGPTAHLAQIASRVSSSPAFRNYPRRHKNEDRPSEDFESEVVYTADRRDELEGLFSNNGCTVVVGGPMYNILSHYLNTQFPAGSELGTRYELFRDLSADGELQQQGVRPKGSDNDPDARVRREVDDFFLEYFVVEKIVRGDHTVIWVAGTSPNSTGAALRELADWKRLAKEEGTRSFARLYELRVPRAFSTHLTEELDFTPDAMSVVRVR